MNELRTDEMESSHDGIEITIEYCDRVNFAMQQNHARLVDSVLLTHNSESLIEGISITVSLENDECPPWTQKISQLDAGSTFRVEPEDLKLSAQSPVQGEILTRHNLCSLRYN